jgi:hypothetical protein
MMWDTRVVWIEKRRRWWWNAWNAAIQTELHGFADSQDAAHRDMRAALKAHMAPVDLDARRRRSHGAA